jgi:hypothetical protein
MTSCRYYRIGNNTGGENKSSQGIQSAKGIEE